MRTSRTWRTTRVTLLLLFALFFLVPLYAMLDFSTRDIGGGRSGAAWAALVTDPDLSSAIVTSLVLALLTVLGMLLLLLPTMIWVRLRIPNAGRLVEFLCLLPLAIPALVIVVGMRNVYTWVNYLVSDSVFTLTFVYVVLVLPYAYRAIDAALSAIDVVTLSEAARSLGAGWLTVITRVVVPNIWSGVLSAAFISVALVLGEFTIASLTNYENLQVVINFLGKSAARTSVAASLAALLFGFTLLLALSYVGRGRGREGRPT
ncbi:MAG TPA: ABC transporter permease subunit [Nocardioidaceae bacterium]|nr:ABC transporter permease subunit [Nocardioidaceae bacterium]